MGHNLFVLILLGLVALLQPLGLPSSLMAPLTSATLLILPGYSFSYLIWPSGLSASRRLALMPFLSLLLLLAISIIAWMLIPAATSELIRNIILLIASMLALAGALVQRHISQAKAAPAAGERTVLASTALIFLCFTLLVAALANSPSPELGAGGLALRISSDQQFVYDPQQELLAIPLVITSDPSWSPVALRLSGSISGTLVAQQQLALAPGASETVTLRIPGQLLSEQSRLPLVVQLEPAEGQGASLGLKLWLPALKD